MRRTLASAGLLAALTAVIGLISLAGWRVWLALMPLACFLFHRGRKYLERLKAENVEARQVTALHLRTIESLALAIEAKYYATMDHLRRVQIYAVEMGRELGLSPPELEALRTAALLHDVGILAVPEQIISKPGRLTREELERVKIHPTVGAEILERMQFPYAVAPIVRAHHEKWNGTGYPLGLKGEQIPVGARILAVADCLAALRSDRPYRRSMSLEQAVGYIASEAGASFDARVVEALKQGYRDLERLAGHELERQADAPNACEQGAAFPELTSAVGAAGPSGNLDLYSSITAARREAQAVFELAQELGSSLSLNETFSVLAARLGCLGPFDCLAVYLLRGDKLVPEYVSGESFSLYLSLEIPLGQGISGRVARSGSPILNGDPFLELACSKEAGKHTTMRSALSAPLEGAEGTIGALTLYRTTRNGFTPDDLRLVEMIRPKLALVVENALKYQKAADSASTDYLTGLPNARALFLRLDGELARCRRMGGSVAVLVCDLDGFKQVNDRFGHLEGNKVLCAVSKALQDNCREYDFVARMGGDEFVVLLPGLKEEAVRAKAAELSQAVREAAVRVCAGSATDLSVGMARFPETGHDAEQLLARADQEMYQSKQRRKALAVKTVAPAPDFDWVGASVH